MSKRTERRPRDPKVQEFVDFLHPPAITVPKLEINTLYGGIGGRLGRLGVYMGIDSSNKSPKYYGYRRAINGVLLLTEEVDLRKDANGSPINTATYTSGTYFQPYEPLGQVPADLSDESLIHWLVKQDLFYTQSLLMRVQGAGSMFAELGDLYQSEIDNLKNNVQLLEDNLTLIDSSG